MFTGLIEETGKLTKLEKTPQGAILTIECKIIPEDIKIGSSVSINGACHTVIEYTKNTITVQTSNETLKVSNFSLLKIADIVNLERAITLNSRLDGHIVTGHIDGTAEFLQKTNDGFSNKLFFKLEENLSKYTIYKGSIAINGISLTIADETAEGIEIAVIPHTWENTALNNLCTGRSVNIEFDIISKYIEKNLIIYHNKSRINLNFLEENGFA